MDIKTLDQASVSLSCQRLSKHASHMDSAIYFSCTRVRIQYTTGAGGGDTVTIQGIGFAGTYSCVFGSVAVPTKLVSANVITCDTPTGYGTTRPAGERDTCIRES